MKSKDDEVLAALLPFELDAITHEKISPEKLPQYGGQARLVEVDEAYAMLDKADKPEVFYKAMAILIFHARHLNPVEHANLAKLIFHPFKRGSGRPKSIELRAAIDDFVFARSLGWNKTPSEFSSPEMERSIVTGQLAQRYGSPKKVVNRLLLEAEAARNAAKLLKR